MEFLEDREIEGGGIFSRNSELDNNNEGGERVG